jgi:hypothetical protein
MRQKIYWNRICEVTTSTYPLGFLGSVFLFKTILYTRNEFMMGTISSRISQQLRYMYIYSVRRCRWNVVSKTYWLYLWVIWRVSYKRHELFILCGHLCWLCPFCSYFFLCCPIMCLSVLSSATTTKKNPKRMFNSSVSPVVCRRENFWFE